MKKGRKSKFEELQIIERYAELSGPAFAFIKECFESNVKSDKMWAVEQLTKGFSRMIPQKIGLGGDPDNQTPIPIYNAKSVK